MNSRLAVVKILLQVTQHGRNLPDANAKYAGKICKILKASICLLMEASLCFWLRPELKKIAISSKLTSK